MWADTKGDAGEGPGGNVKDGNESFYCLGEYTYCHEQYGSRNMNVKGPSTEASEGHEKTKTITGQ